MFVTILSLTCVYAVLAVFSVAQLVFVVYKSYLDFYPDQESTDNKDNSTSNKTTASSDGPSSETNQSGSKSSVPSGKESRNRSLSSPRHRSHSAANHSHFVDPADSVACGLDRFGFFLLITDIAIIICCVCTLMFAVILLLMFLSLAPCFPGGPTVASIYQINKSSLYFIFVARVDNIFSGTAFAYSKKYLRSLMAINIVGTLGVMIANVTFLRLGSIKSHGLTMCMPEMPPMVGMAVVSFDLIMSAILMHMFISPLRKIYAMELKSQMENVSSVSPPSSPKLSTKVSKETKQQLKKTSQVRRIAVKCRLLTFTAIFFTFIAIILIVALDFGDFVIWDMIVSNLSAIFMTTWADDYFETVCCVPLMIESSVKKACSAMKSSY